MPLTPKQRYALLMAGRTGDAGWTWAMMLLGFAGVGFLAYRRSRKDNGLALAAA